MTRLIFILIILVLAVNGNTYSQTPDELNKVLEAIPAEDLDEICRLAGQVTDTSILSEEALINILPAIARQGDTESFMSFAGHIFTKRNIFRGYTDWLIINAVRGGNLEILKFVLETYGMPGYNTYEDKFSILVDAAEQNNLEMVKLLIKYRANVNAVQDNSYKTPLMAAAENGNTEIMSTLIECGADVVRKGLGYYHSPLYYAILGGNVDAVDLLIGNGAGFEQGKWSFQPVVLAAERGYTDIVERLLAGGYNINGWNNNETPLSISIKNGHYKTVKYLLEHGAVPYGNGSNVNWSSGFSLAASNGYIDIVDLFLDHCKDDSRIEKYIAEAMWSASCNGQLDVVRRLLKIGIQVNDLQNLLEGAVVNGQAGSVIFWLDRGGDANAVCCENYDYMYPPHHRPSTLLAKAAEHGYTGIVKLLVERGARIDPEVLDFAAVYGDAEMIGFLVANGAKADTSHLISASGSLNTDNVCLLLSYGLNVNCRDRWHRTPLMLAAMYYYDEMDAKEEFLVVARNVYEISKMLIGNGADVNTRDFEDMTPLMFAVDNGYTETVKLLLSYGARLTDENKFGDKVSDFFNLYTLIGLDTTMLDVLRIDYTPEDIENDFANRPRPKRKYQYKKDWDLLEAIDKQDYDAIKRALEAGADINYYNDGSSPIFNALQNGSSIAILRLLVENGAVVNGTNYMGTTSLMRAVMAGDHSAAEYFINCGADVDRKNGYDNAAMVFAAKNGDLRMIRLLATHGADVNIQGNGYTPLTMARSQGHQQAVELLKSLGAAEDSVDEVN